MGCSGMFMAVNRGAVLKVKKIHSSGNLWGSRLNWRKWANVPCHRCCVCARARRERERAPSNTQEKISKTCLDILS
eukprot:6472789-Amphidinium_carterae.1